MDKVGMPFKYAIGDTVQLLSGGPVMTVIAHSVRDQDGEPVVLCQWGDDRRTANFPEACVYSKQPSIDGYEIWDAVNRQWEPFSIEQMRKQESVMDGGINYSNFQPLIRKRRDHDKAGWE